MTIESNTFLTFSAIGNREDLADTIYNISPTDTPFIANIGKTKATAVLHEWQTDSLADASSDGALEGDEFSAESVSATTREQNRCMIQTREVIVSGTQNAVDSAGRNREIVYQLTKKSKELYRDMEKALLDNYDPVTGNSTTARKMRPLPSWYTTNTSRDATGTPGADGDASNGATDGSNTRALTEGLFLGVVQSIWEQGGDPDMVLVGPFNKRVFSTFDGSDTVSARRDDKDKTLVATISVYESDFGTHKVVADRFSRDRDCHVLTTDLLACAYLRPMQTIDIAKTGDAEKGKVLVEHTLEVKNEAGIGIVADLNTS